MEVSDNAGHLTLRGAHRLIAGKPAPTGEESSVGASLLAMEVSDNAGHLTLRGALRLIANTGGGHL